VQSIYEVILKEGIMKEVTVVIEDHEIDDFEQRVINKVADMLVKPIQENLFTLVSQEVMRLINESVGNILAGVIENPIQKTNQWGEPISGTMTLREVILKQGIDWFSQPVDGYNGKLVDRCSQGIQRAQYLAKKAIEEGIGKDMEAQIKQAVVDVKAQYTGKINDVVTRSIKEVIGLK